MPVHAATNVWIGETNGNWSASVNWLGGLAPAAAGGADQILRFTGGGAEPLTATNDLPGAFSLQALSLERDSPAALTIAGSSLTFTGAGPEIALLGAADTSVSSAIALGPTSGEVTITGSGRGSLFLSGAMSQIAGPQRLVIATTPESPNGQSITLAGANSFTGGVRLDSGNLVLSHNAALGTGTLSMHGGTLRLGTVTLSNAISLHQRLLVQASGTATLSGVIASATPGAGLELRHSGSTLSLTAASTYDGATILDGSLAAALAVSTPGTLRLGGVGSILNSASIQINAGMLLQVDTATSGTLNRIRDDAEIRLRGGRLNYGSGLSGSGGQIETVGAIIGAGYSTITATNTSNASVRLVASSLGRTERGTFLFTGSNLGNAFGSSVGSILFTTPPPDLVGGGGTGSETSILPYAIGDRTAAGLGASLVTYSAATGIRPLNVTTEHVTNLAAAGPTNNVRLTVATTNDDARSLNALALAGGSGISGGGSLAIQSGTVLVSNSASAVSNDFLFGTREANFFTVTGLTVSGAIHGSAGLTKSGTGTLTLQGANTFTGPLTINAGQIGFFDLAGLGVDSSAIIVNGPDAGISYTGGNALLLARAIETRNGVARVASTGGGVLTLAGGIQGSGGVRLTGTNGSTIALAPVNSYAGPTLFSTVTVLLPSDAALGAGGGIHFSAGSVILGSDWTSAREISVGTVAQVDTAGFSATWSGLLTGTGSLLKRGAGELSLVAAMPFTGGVTVDGGSVRLASGASLRGTAYSVRDGARLVLDHGSAPGAAQLRETAVVTLAGGELELRGSTIGLVQENVSQLTVPADAGTGLVTLLAPGAFGTSLRLRNGIASGGGDLLLRGLNPDGLNGNPITRVTADVPPAPGAIVPGVFAAAAIDGTGDSFVLYDSAMDAAGEIGYRPLSAAEYSGGALLQNPANGGATPEAAHFLAGAATTASGANNTIQTLTMESGGSLSLGAGQTVTISSGSVLAKGAGASAEIAGGTLAFGTKQAAFFTAGDLDIGSAITGSGGLRKGGAGVLTLLGAAAYGEPTQVMDGTLRVAGTAFAGRSIQIGSSGALGIATPTASLGAVTGIGNLAVGTGTLTLGTLGSDFTFGGGLSGTGGVILEDGGNPAALRRFDGASSFSGTLRLNSGRLSIGNAGAFGTGTLIIAGGSLRVPFATSLALTLQLETDLIVLGSAQPRFATGTTVSGAHDVVVRGSGGLGIEGPLSLPANLRSTYGPDDEYIQTPGAIEIFGPQGALVVASAVRLESGGSLVLNDGSAFAGGTGGRIGDAVPVHLAGATLQLIGNATAPTNEFVSRIASAGFSTLLMTPAAGTTTTLVAAEMERVERGTFLLRASTGALGGVAGANVGQIRLSTPPALVGGGGTGPATSIVPWAVGAAPDYGLLTHDANGFRRLVAGEYATLAAAGPADNVLLNATTDNTATRQINSLSINGTQVSLTGTGTLAILGGAVLNGSTSVATIANNLDFGAAEAQFFLPGSGMQVDGALTGSGGWTKSGPGGLTLSGVNTITGPITINGGSVAFYSGANLGGDTSPITLRGNARLWLGSSGLTMVNREVRIDDGIAEFYTSLGAGTLAISGPVSGTSGLTIRGNGFVALSPGNTYSGSTYVEAGLSIAADSSLGSGSTVFFNEGGKLRLEGDWNTMRRIEIACPVVIDTNGHAATWSGPLVRTSPGALMKNGAGTLTVTTASDFSGRIDVSGGALRLADAGALASGVISLTAGTSLVLDNSSGTGANRVSDSGSITLSSAELRQLGHPTMPVSERLGTLTMASFSTITLTAPGTAANTLTLTSLENFGVLVVSGDQLGGSNGGFTRVTIQNPPAFPGGIVPGTLASSSGSAPALAIYDTTSDAAGVIGIRPLRAADFTTSAEIRNPANGGTTPVMANFRMNGPTTTVGASNTISSLTLAAGSTLTLDAGETLALQSNGLFVEPGAPTLISGGAVSFGTGSAIFHAGSDLTFRSGLTASSVTKMGSGHLLFEPSAPYAGTFSQVAGDVMVGPGNALSGALVNVSSGTTLDFASNPAELVRLRGAGTIRLGTSTLQVQGPTRLAGSSSFSGEIAGTGGVISRGEFFLSAPASYSGPTSVISRVDAGGLDLASFWLFGGGTALATSSLSAAGNASIVLENSSQVLDRVGVVPVTLNSSSFELAGNALAPVSENLGLLTGSGYSKVIVDAAANLVPVTLGFSGLSRHDRGSFYFPNDDSGPLGNGTLTLTFGSGLTSALIGRNTTPTNRGILPFATGGGFLTYDPVDGIRSLGASEYSATLTAGDNVSLSGNVPAQNSNVAVNALRLNGNSLFGTGIITIESGAFFSTTSFSTVENALAFGAAEAHFLTSGDTTVNGAISGSNGLTKSGTAKLTLNGTNTFTGPLTVNSGTLAFSKAASLGAGTAEIVLNDATLEFFAATQAATLTRPIRTNGALNATIRGSYFHLLTIAGPISGTAGLQTDDLVRLNGNNTFAGDVLIRSGTLTIASDATLGVGSKVRLGDSSSAGAILKLAAPWTTNREIEAGFGATTIDTAGFDATVLGPLSGSSTLTKGGIGLLTLDDVTNFRGSLVASVGTLRVNGPTPSIGSVVVNGAATFRGSMQGAMPFDVAGTLSPGDGVGGISTGSLTLQAGSTFNLAFDSATEYDHVSVAGTMTLAVTVNLTLDFRFDPVDLVDEFAIINNDGTDPVAFVNNGRFRYAGVPLDEGAQFLAGTQLLQISYAGGTGNDVVIRAVPEPGSAGLCAAGVLALAAVRRRRRVPLRAAAPAK